jgi:predicted small lipoprotein YifL
MHRSALVKADLATHLRRIAVLMLVVGAVAGCGRKGALEPAPSATAKAGDEGEAKPAQQPGSGGISGLRGKKPPPVLPSKTPSILDPILE